MARDFVINGECLVKVKGMGELAEPSTGIDPDRPKLWELGLASEGITISPVFKHQDVQCDDFGPSTPPETMWMLAEVGIRMVLVHYDKDVLEACLSESMAGGVEGTFVGAGTPMGGGRPPLWSGCHYISLNLLSPVLDYPWHFPTAYLAERPVELPLGVGTTMVVCNWRAIAYDYPFIYSSGTPGASGFLSGQVSVQVAEMFSSGGLIWNHTIDQS